ncbi:MAG: 2-oxoacid:acceptor oxidoreductase family protein [Deltaproteobacteria bacterium]|nr:2-oxoacid:acceptor oxidoreductase family protein [Deltaproteobacteria bacterium]
MGYDIVWHGRGGQGVVVAAHILAQAAYLEGFGGITSAPQFGPERRGAPLTASTRISSTTIRTVSQVQKADIAVVLDPSLMRIINIAATLNDGGLIVINTNLQPHDFPAYAEYAVATCDALHIANGCGLLKDGSAVVNAPMVGALARASGIISLSSLEKVFTERFKGVLASVNLMAVNEAYVATILKKRGE